MGTARSPSPEIGMVLVQMALVALHLIALDNQAEGGRGRLEPGLQGKDTDLWGTLQ